MKRKSNNFFRFLFLVSFFCLIIPTEIFAATLSFSPSSLNTKVGDLISVKIVLKSNDSVNAVSGEVQFSTEYLNFSHFSKSGSILNLWAQEPSCSNNSGIASFEGVILNGYSGNGGTVLTIYFRTKKEGETNLDFITASVLANDGKGTEKITGTSSVKINIEKAAIPEKEITTKTEEEKKPAMVTISEEVVEKIKEVEKTENLPNYSLVTIFCLVIILILILVITYGVYYILKFKNFIKKKLSSAEKNISDNFKNLEKEIEKDFKIYPKNTEENQKFQEKEPLNKLEEQIENSKEKILNDIKEIEKGP